MPEASQADNWKTVPCFVEVKKLLKALGFAQALELGIVLDVEPRRLLHQARQREQSAAFLNKLLRKAAPFPVQKLADLLESPLMQAPELAAQVMEWAEKAGKAIVTCQDREEHDQLTQLLLPVAERSKPLGLALGVRERSFAIIAGVMGQRDLAEEWEEFFYAYEFKRSMNFGLEGKEWRHSAEEWMQALALTGASGRILEKVAQHWQLALPASCADWNAWRKACHSARLAEVLPRVLEQKSADQDTKVPLSTAWMLVSRYINHDVAGADAGNNMAPPPTGAATPGWHTALNLVRSAKAPSCRNDGIRCDDLLRMARAGCAEPALLQQTTPRPVARETCSRRLNPADLELLAGCEAPEQEARKIAAVLGVCHDLACHDCDSAAPPTSPKAAALRIWHSVCQRIPWLETGHLVQLFHALGKEALVELWLGDRDLDLKPVQPWSGRTLKFMTMARELRQKPEWAQAFVDRHPDTSRNTSGEATPVAMAMPYRLLERMASDRALLNAFRLFQDPSVGDCTDDGLPYDFLCPVAMTYMDDPVPLPMSHGGERYFSRAHVMSALEQQGPFHPMTRARLLPDQVGPVDQAMLQRIRHWRAQNPDLEVVGAPFPLPEKSGN